MRISDWSSDVCSSDLLVCEEAHRYIPSKDVGTGQAARKILERIAKEGRKYGVSLGLITQRPSALAEGVLSQCGPIISVRLNHEREQHFVQAAMHEDARRSITIGRASCRERVWHAGEELVIAYPT